MNVLVTGGAGFIGSHLVDRLLAEGHSVTTVDNFDPFYSPAFKRDNIAAQISNPRFRLVCADVRDLPALRLALNGGKAQFDVIVHIAAKAGVRPSILDPVSYQQVNIGGTQSLLEYARECGVTQFVYASSSSVYGVNPDVPWCEEATVLRPISPYAATKVAGELLGHTYSYLHDIRFIALRFFTVYGPRQRPDLAIRRFAERMLAGQSVPLYGDGSTSRDYTYVADIVEGVRAAMDYRESAFEIINLGGDRPIPLQQLVEKLAGVLGLKPIIDRQPPQLGDVPHTWADIRKAQRLLDYRISMSLEEGLGRFSDWLLKSSPNAGRGSELS